ncbi:MAG TPA: hypothetical protein VFY89_08080 [Ktedonobacterales bacterium]
MPHEHPLAYLPAYIAAARAQGQPTRLVLRNTDRVGVIHLYFFQHRLVLVEGHRGAGAASLRDLATWQQGTMRRDDLAAPPPGAAQPDAQLETVLSETLRQMELRGLLTHAAPPASDPATLTSRPSQPRLPAIMPPLLPPTSAPRIASVPRGPAPSTPLPGSAGLPPLPDGPAPDRLGPGHALSELATTRTPSVIGTRRATPTINTRGQINDDQWRTLARFLHLIIERAARSIQLETAIGFMMQALTKTATGSLILGGLEVDAQGWLQPRREGFLAGFPTYEISQAIAELIQEYEVKCAQFTNPQEARSIIIEAAAPLRRPLASLGLDIADQ